jgi:hypothetical protein
METLSYYIRTERISYLKLYNKNFISRKIVHTLCTLLSGYAYEMKKKTLTMKYQ